MMFFIFAGTMIWLAWLALRRRPPVPSPIDLDYYRRKGAATARLANRLRELRARERKLFNRGLIDNTGGAASYYYESEAVAERIRELDHEIFYTIWRARYRYREDAWAHFCAAFCAEAHPEMIQEFLAEERIGNP